MAGSWLACTVLCTGLAAPPTHSDIFPDVLLDTPPQVVQTTSRQALDTVERTRFLFVSRTLPETGQRVMIDAVLAKPTVPGPHPAILVCHGGGATVETVTPHVTAWAKRGYVSLAVDQPGFCHPRKTRSSGPWLNHGALPFRIVDRPEDAALYDGIVAALRGLALLRSMPEVDSSRVGVTGGSWGGYMTTMVAGLAGERVRAAFSVYGCGYFDLGCAWLGDLAKLTPAQRTMWLAHLDAGRYAGNITAGYFLAAASNDWYFWPPAVMRTYSRVSRLRNLCIGPNDNHTLRVPGGTHGPPRFDSREHRTYMEIPWFDYHLRDQGKPFPQVATPGKATPHDAHHVKVAFRATGAEPFESVTVWYAAAELPWRLRWWQAVPTTQAADHEYEAVLPVHLHDQEIDWIAVVTDKRQITVSSQIETLSPWELGVSSDALDKPVFRQDFENPDEHRRWQRAFRGHRGGKMRIGPQAARTGRFGLELTGEATFMCLGLRGKALNRAGVRSLRMWMRAVEAPCLMPRVQLLAELPDGRRCTWTWRNPPPIEVPTTWTHIEVPLSEMLYDDQVPRPVPESALGQLQLITDGTTHIHVDDVEAR